MEKIKDDLKIKSKQLSKSNAETVLEYRAAVTTKNTYVANRMVGVIGKLFNYAKNKGYYFLSLLIL
ncbi:hypothetical protein OAN92_05235 [Candidatus Pelagibacter ubique]|nr:hypothetical protein [Candidatus Pelagibacter ubique]